MARDAIQVTEWMADFIQWVDSKGYDEIQKMIRDHIMEIKAQNDVSKESRIDEGFKWDDALEPNDGNDQWKHGGDCNMCRKVKYCGRQCRANKVLKKVATPSLYQQYLTENPEAAAKNPHGLDTESIMKQLGVVQ